MSDTPRTDAEAEACGKINFVFADFARKLERENADLRQLLKETVADLDALIDRLQVEAE